MLVLFRLLLFFPALTLLILFTAAVCYSFYDGAGQIDQAELQKHVEKGKEVVGWFKFRRHSTLTPSYRERLVHRELLRSLKVKPEKFLFVILTADWNELRSTHTFRYNVTLYNDGADSFFNTELKVANLDQSSHDGYSALSIPTVSSTPREGQLVDAYATIIGHLQARVGGSQLTDDARAAEDAFQGTVDEIDSLAGRLGNANQEIEMLENEIRMLEQGASSPPLAAGGAESELSENNDGSAGGGGGSSAGEGSNPMDAAEGGSQDSDVVSVDLASSQSQGGLPATNPFARGKSPEFE